ncbi:MAG: site-specific DNA-methyltransferase [Rhodobacteraceae bacterium]|nr:site-specific DNA-methyltransferase [Paracoccaceae bacterium]
MNSKTGKAFSIFNGDCRTVLKSVAKNSIDLVATDPPYFIHGMGNEWSDEQLQKGKQKGHAIGGLPVGMKFDPEQGRRLETFMTELGHLAFAAMKPGAYFLAFSQPRLTHRMAIALENAGFEIRDLLIWEHQGGQGKAFSQDHFVQKMNITEQQKAEILAQLGGRKTPQLRPKFETIVLAQKPREGTFVENYCKWKTGLIDLNFDPHPSTVFEFSKPKREQEIDHMTVKPIDLMARLIEVFSAPGQLVFDPFLGSGTTGVAAAKVGRRIAGCEIEPRYFKMAHKRIEKAYGEKQT